MEKVFLMVERMVLESLAGAERSREAIIEDTQLAAPVVDNILASLVERDYVIVDDKYYRLNQRYVQEWQAKLVQTEIHREEVREMLTSLVNEYFRTIMLAGNSNASSPATLKIRKFWVDEAEALILSCMLTRLEKFVRDLERKNEKKSKNRLLAKKQVIVWGQADYGSLAKESLEVI